MIAVLAIAAVALHVEEVRTVPTATVSQVVSRLAAGIEARTGARVALDASQWVDCRGKPRSICVEELRDDEVIMLVLIGGITKLRVFAQRFSAAGTSKEQAIDLPRRSEEWDVILGSLIAELYPEPAAKKPPDPALPPPPAQDARASSRIPSWIALGVSVVAAGAALIVQAESANLQTELTTGIRAPSETAALLDDRRNTQRVADVLWIGACASAAGAMAFAFLDF